MKKTLLLVFTLGILQLTQAQVDFGVKAGINYNSDAISNFKDITREYETKAEGKLGYHAGIWTRFNLPITGLYIRPELVYTALKSEVSIISIPAIIKNSKQEYTFQKIDLPILLGYKFGNVVSVFAGPSFQYIIDKDFNLENIKNVTKDEFSVGLQLGAGVEFGKFGVDVRWERGFSDSETEFINKNNSSEKINFDTRISQVILGVSYKF